MHCRSTSDYGEGGFAKFWKQRSKKSIRHLSLDSLSDEETEHLRKQVFSAEREIGKDKLDDSNSSDVLPNDSLKDLEEEILGDDAIEQQQLLEKPDDVDKTHEDDSDEKCADDKIENVATMNANEEPVVPAAEKEKYEDNNVSEAAQADPEPEEHEPEDRSEKMKSTDEPEVEVEEKPVEPEEAKAPDEEQSQVEVEKEQVAEVEKEEEVPENAEFEESKASCIFSFSNFIHHVIF